MRRVRALHVRSEDDVAAMAVADGESRAESPDRAGHRHTRRPAQSQSRCDKTRPPIRVTRRVEFCLRPLFHFIQFTSVLPTRSPPALSFEISEAARAVHRTTEQVRQPPVQARPIHEMHGNQRACVRGRCGRRFCFRRPRARRRRATFQPGRATWVESDHTMLVILSTLRQFCTMATTLFVFELSFIHLRRTALILLISCMYILL